MGNIKILWESFHFYEGQTGKTLTQFSKTSSPYIDSIICQSLNTFWKFTHPNFDGIMFPLLLLFPQHSHVHSFPDNPCCTWSLLGQLCLQNISLPSTPFHYPALGEDAPMEQHSAGVKWSSDKKNISAVALKPAVSKFRCESTVH